MSQIASITDASLARLPGVRHGFFTRAGGVSSGTYDSLNCGWGTRGDTDENVQQNRARVAAELGVSPDSLITVRQSHGNTAVVAEECWDRTSAPAADAIVTTRPGIALGVLSADCAPVLLADSRAGVIGVAHAGWRGAVAGILEAAVVTMEQCGAARGRIVAAIGPTIAQPDYEVGLDLRQAVLDDDGQYVHLFRSTSAPDRWLFDLPGYVGARMRAADVAEVGWVEHCTYERPDMFFSHRRQVTHGGEADYGRQISAIVLR